ncbi:deacetylase [Bacillus coahuilensis m2-6]|uniref:bacillithiol biosynthesis deacetylase BshB1 n=1 Tax=Bacillus coahuilensis TaxID=408580 RepID=UPI000185103F|nr:bacillithiol biosynthesis deacetylase BshB1 [Bacillus coahuilensis]KUP08040.1 deacetylase [Bacillus coahuilensis m2-6]
MTVDILAFGAHADDVEIGMAGTIAKLSGKGKKVVICDITKAELSSNGTVETRQIEAKNAADILGVYERITLDLPDRGIMINDESIGKLVEVIRRYEPTLVFAPYQKDRHPDHGRVGDLVKEAVFSAKIHKYKPDRFHAHNVQALYYYFINGFTQPSFVIDIEPFMNTKLTSLKCYTSQFYQRDGVKTPLTEGYLEGIEARERVIGKMVGKKFAEGFLSDTPLVLKDDLLGDFK